MYWALDQEDVDFVVQGVSVREARRTTKAPEEVLKRCNGCIYT